MRDSCCYSILFEEKAIDGTPRFYEIQNWKVKIEDCQQKLLRARRTTKVADKRLKVKVIAESELFVSITIGCVAGKLNYVVKMALENAAKPHVS